VLLLRTQVTDICFADRPPETTALVVIKDHGRRSDSLPARCGGTERTTGRAGLARR